MNTRNPLAAQELLTFRLGEEEFGIDILQVQEIRSYEPPTRIANAPPYLKGVVNLRGVIVPVLDLRLRLGYSETRVGHLTAVVVLHVGGKVSGVMVDAVSDVVNLPAETVKPVPAVGQLGAAQAHHIRGIATLGERLLMLLDMDALMADATPGGAAVAAPEASSNSCLLAAAA